MGALSLVMLLLALSVGIASIRRNWTGIALALSWAAGFAMWRLTGEGVPLKMEVIRDYCVLIVIFVKTSARDCIPFGGLLGQARACWVQLSWWDKAVVCLFVPMWITYAVAMDPRTAYWISWTAAVLQFMAAGAEAFEHWRRGRARMEAADPTDRSLRRSGLVRHEC